MQPAAPSIVRHYPLALGLAVLLLPYLYNILLLPFSTGGPEPTKSLADRAVGAETGTSSLLSSTSSISFPSPVAPTRTTPSSTRGGFRFWGPKETQSKSTTTSTSAHGGKARQITVTKSITRSPSTKTRTTTSTRTTTALKVTTSIKTTTAVRTTTSIKPTTLVKTTTLHNTKTVTTSVTETEVLEIVQEIPVIEQVHNTKTVTTSVTETEVFEIVREIPVIEQVPKQEESYIIDEIDSMGWHQTTFALASRARGCYLITDEVCKNVPEIKKYKVGLLHLFIQHTSAALTINENWDSDVRKDMIDALDKLAPEDADYRHNAEGSDDMPAHIKAVLAGTSVSIPITGGKLGLGTWQGIYLCEFRKSAHRRTLVATIQGE